MLAKDIIKDAKASWAIANPNYNYSSTLIKSRRINRSSVVKVKLVDTDYYDLNGVWNWQDFPDNFKKAPAGQKGSKGFLVVSEDNSKYIVVSAKNFIDTYGEMEAYWSVQEKVEAQEKERQGRMSEVRDAALGTARANADSLKESAVKSLMSVLKTVDSSTSVNVRADGEWARNEDGTVDETRFNARTFGTVELSLRDFQRLMEKLYEAQDALA
jgi:hypothetical protein